MKARRKRSDDSDQVGYSPSAAGAGIDVYGGPVIDPTKNVLDLVRAESKYQDAMRDAEAKLAATIALAERRRIDDLAALRLIYDQRIAEDLRVNVKTASDQLATQLVKETTSLSSQIGTMAASFTQQLTAMTKSFSSSVTALNDAITPRIADLERFRWEQGGKTSVSDPAVTAAIAEMTKAIKSLELARDTAKGHYETMSAHTARLIAISAVVAIILVGIGQIIVQIVIQHTH